MEKVNQKKMAIAIGLTSVAIYLGCFFVMLFEGY
jgi:hypothetical protein